MFEITGHNLTVKDIVELSQEKTGQIKLAEKARKKVIRSREFLDKEVEKGRVIYGVNTGMGGFVDRLIPAEHAEQLQINLLNAVASNVGNYLEAKIVRAAMLARINSLAQGNSAITEQNLEKLIEIYNAGIVPCIPEKGSLGASGDLGPLACIALVGLGLWKAKIDNEIVSGSEALKRYNIEPMKLSYKEGLALINGTSAMTGFAAHLIYAAKKLLDVYLLSSAMTIEALCGAKKPFNPIVHAAKPHQGQYAVAKTIFEILQDSTMARDEDITEAALRKEVTDSIKRGSRSIEDAYSLRTTPQLIGPVKENIESIIKTVENELNSSNDNPLILAEAEDIFHNGHFQGQYISMAMDQLAISLTTLSNLSDRRIDRFLDENNSNGLPPFLCERQEGGLRFGLMGGQFMSTSLASENRSLCSPVSIQSLPSTADFQDIVSLGFVAARRTSTILDNTKYVVSFEIICAAQAADIRGKEKLSSRTKVLHSSVRKLVPYFEKDEILTDYLEQVKAKIVTLG